MKTRTSDTNRRIDLNIEPLLESISKGKRIVILVTLASTLFFSILSTLRKPAFTISTVVKIGSYKLSPSTPINVIEPLEVVVGRLNDEYRLVYSDRSAEPNRFWSTSDHSMTFRVRDIPTINSIEITVRSPSKEDSSNASDFFVGKILEKHNEINESASNRLKTRLDQIEVVTQQLDKIYSDALNENKGNTVIDLNSRFARGMMLSDILLKRESLDAERVGIQDSIYFNQRNKTLVSDTKNDFKNLYLKDKIFVVFIGLLVGLCAGIILVLLIPFKKVEVR